LVAASVSNSADLLGKDFKEQSQIDALLCAIEDLQCGRLDGNTFVALTKDGVEKSGHLTLGRLTLADMLLWSVIEGDGKVLFVLKYDFKVGSFS
jgi:hypothetical protein